MSFSRDPTSAPRLSQIAVGSISIITFNFALLVGSVAVIANVPWVSRTQILGPVPVFVALALMFYIAVQSLVQWIYVIPLCVLLRSRRGLVIGLLLGAVLYMVGHVGLISLEEAFLYVNTPPIGPDVDPTNAL